MCAEELLQQLEKHISLRASLLNHSTCFIHWESYIKCSWVTFFMLHLYFIYYFCWPQSTGSASQTHCSQRYTISLPLVSFSWYWLSDQKQWIRILQQKLVEVTVWVEHTDQCYLYLFNQYIYRKDSQDSTQLAFLSNVS